MRGESGEAIVGSGTIVSGDDMGVTRHDGGGIKSPSSPPLSAAASQVSLAPSDLTTSDPDIAGSSAYSSAPPSRPPSSSQMSLATSDLTNSELDLTSTHSVPSSAASSRPPSSSSGIVATDLALPAPEDYMAETVEFPRSPMALKSEGSRVGGVCFVEVEDSTIRGGGSRCATPSGAPAFLTPNYKADELENNGNSPRQGDGFEVGSDLEEDYFEEFHLPNSHENAFVRHKSFKRKVHLTPIDAPDAEKIEGLVRTGELQRHGSIRRKITEDPSASPQQFLVNGNLNLDRNKNIQNAETDFPQLTEVGTFAKDLKEIENMLDDSDNVGEDISDIVDEENSSRDALGSLESSEIAVTHNHPPQHMMRSNTSTPIPRNSKAPANYATMELSMTTTEESIIDESNEESLSIEQSTLMKVRECLDFTNYKDLYNLSGRLQDILTPREVEEILNNSDRYSEYVNKEVIEALHNSLQEHLNSNSSGNIDSGISSPKKMISADGVELGSSLKSDIRAVLDGSTVSNEGEVNSSKKSSEMFVDEDLDDDEAGFRFERRRSLRLSKEGVKELEVEGVFVESKSQDIGLKKISAPSFDLSCATNEDYSDVPDLSTTDITDTSCSDKNVVSDKACSDTAVNVTLPDIVITNVNDEVYETEDSTVSKLMIEASDVSDMTTPNVDSSSDNTFNFKTPDEERPTSLILGNTNPRKVISVADDILHSPNEDDNISVASAFSHRSDGEYDDIEDDFETPDVHVRCKIYPNLDPVPPPPAELIPEFSAAEESSEERHWRSVVIGGVWRRIDMKVIAPYRKCISHGGYLGDGEHAVIVICACHLPDRSRRDYNYVMDNLFLYVLSTLEQLIAEDYVLVYLAGGTPKANMPNFHWLKRAYQMIDRKLRKNLKALHVVHPTFWVRTVVAFSRPFISTKFYRKLTFVNNLTELAQVVPLDQLEIPDAVKQADFELMIREKKKNMGRRRPSSATSR